MLESIYFFIIGAFVGWVLECVFKFVTKNFKKTPGILNTPFCILYGLGTVALSMIINRVTNNFFMLFLLSMIVLTTMEYITAILLKKIYDVQLWNYNNMTFSINEKVCLEFSLIWGLLGAVYIKYLLPMLRNFFIVSQTFAFKFAIVLILGIIIADFIYSSYILIRDKKQIELKENV